MKVKEIMRTPVIVAKPYETVGKTLDIMNKEKINGMPIVDDGNNLLGIIVKADIYRFLMDPGHYKSCPVEWVMVKEVAMAQKDESILEVGKRLRDKNVIALPIMDKEALVGIITIEDILDYFLKLNKK